jgi:energy-coupling factor transport system ATP-binding protein
MAMEPSVLLLDDPRASSTPSPPWLFLNTLKRINQELGTAVLLSEHRLAEVLPLADQMAVLEEGRILALGPPREVGLSLFEKKHPLFRAMPAPMQIFLEAGGEGKAPLTVGEGRRWLNQG